MAGAGYSLHEVQAGPKVWPNELIVSGGRNTLSCGALSVWVTFRGAGSIILERLVSFYCAVLSLIFSLNFQGSRPGPYDLHSRPAKNQHLACT